MNSRGVSAKSKNKTQLDNQEALEEELEHQIKKANLLGSPHKLIRQ
jgi:hypothetical protein